jgi:hypothetical protein
VRHKGYANDARAVVSIFTIIVIVIHICWDLCVRHLAKYLICIILLNHHISFLKGSERLHSLPKVKG